MSTQEAKHFKDLDMVLVEWVDVHEKDGWRFKDQLIKLLEEEDERLFLCRTVGWILKEGKYNTTLVSTESITQFSDINVIPNCCIIRRVSLDERTRSPGRAKKKR